MYLNCLLYATALIIHQRVEINLQSEDNQSDSCCEIISIDFRCPTILLALLGGT